MNREMQLPTKCPHCVKTLVAVLGGNDQVRVLRCGNCGCRFRPDGELMTFDPYCPPGKLEGERRNREAMNRARAYEVPYWAK